MEIEERKAVNVKVHWGKQKLDFKLDFADDVDTLRGRSYSSSKAVFPYKRPP